MDAVLVSDGYAISYRRTGAGPRLLWVDPALGSSAMRPLQPAIDALAARFEVVTYDRRGRGCNQPARTSRAREIEDLAALVAHLGGVTAVLGFSSGAALVLHAGQRLEARALVLLEAAIDEELDDSGMRQRIGLALEEGDLAGAVLMFYEATGAPEEVVTGLTTSSAWPHVLRAAPTLIADLDLALVSDDAVAAVQTPVHLVVSEGSPEEITGMSDRLAARLTAHVWREPGGWHGVDPDALADRLQVLLASDVKPGQRSRRAPAEGTPTK